jgi:Trk K+ transport system NAD-binding subunit
VAGRRLGDIPLPSGCVIVAVLREGDPLLHDPDVVLAAEDEVLAVVHSAAAAELARLLGRATAEV